MSSDAAADVLMDRLTDVDKRRRRVTMKHKEVEAKLGLLAEEEKALERKRAAEVDEEIQLKRELEALTTENNAMQLQLQLTHDRVRSAEAEEPLLHNHAVERLAALKADAKTWTDRLSELENLNSTWLNDPILTEIKKARDAVEEDISQIKKDIECAERELLNTTMEIARLQEVAARRNSGGSAALDSASTMGGSGLGGQNHGGLTLLFTEQDVMHADGVQDKEAQDLMEEIAQAERQRAAMQREVSDLTSRSDELEKWLQDMTTSRDTVISSKKLLMECTAGHVCTACLPQP